MSDFEQQNDTFGNDEPARITDLGSREPRQKGRVENRITVLHRSMARPWIRYSLIGVLFLIPLGIAFFRLLSFRLPTPPAPLQGRSLFADASPMTSTPIPPTLLALQQRPLHLPTIAPDTPCPTTPEKTIDPSLGIVQGDGPVYATVGTAAASPAVVYYTDAQHFNGGIGNQGWGGQRVFWLVDPDYRGSVLIRGHQLDGSHALRFGTVGGPSLAQQLAVDTTPGNIGSWGGSIAYTRLQAPGCYAYQVDGDNFSYMIVFLAVVQN
jgi:hypothetical protein